MKKIIEKNKFLIIVFIICFAMLISIIAIILNNKSKILNYSTDDYRVKYSSIWKVKTKKRNEIVFKHKSKSMIKIDITYLDSEYKHDELLDLVENLLYHIEKQNPDYKLIAKEPSKITKKAYDGYKVLYENKDSQALVVIGKVGNRLMMVSYESKDKYFDVLLDSVQSIIYNFELLDEKITASYKLKSLKTSEVKFSKSKNEKIVENKKYEIASDNYLVKYSIPDNFELSDFDSSGNYFNYKSLKDGTIKLSTSISNKNVYEWLNDDSSSFNREIKYIKDNPKTHIKFKENLEKIGKTDNFIYKASYVSNTKHSYEKAYLIYSLGYKRAFIIEIESNDVKISNDIIKNIKMLTYQNYAEYIYRNIDNGYLKNEMKKMVKDYDSNDKNYFLISLLTPEKYKEIYHNSLNVYEYRYFGLDYDEDNYFYKYNVTYQLSTLSNI
ncbi:MAG: hypothetical protein RSA10_01160, partial [Bacilli bacterium]